MDKVKLNVGLASYVNNLILTFKFVMKIKY